jgi:hypothetical protein
MLLDAVGKSDGLPCSGDQHQVAARKGREAEQRGGDAIQPVKIVKQPPIEPMRSQLPLDALQGVGG